MPKQPFRPVLESGRCSGCGARCVGRQRDASCRVIAACMALVVAACSKTDTPAPITQPDAPAARASAVPRADAVRGWLGTWNGPEGTYLTLTARSDSTYEVIIKNLDGARSFEGVAGPDLVYFERDGKQETIRATDGNATGMKWLAGKSRCLTVRAGEGYCRDQRD